MDHHIITDDQVEAFERDGVVTVDTPWSGKLIEDVSEIMDRQLALYVDEVTQSRPELDYADLVPCVARAGQVTVLNVATIHSATTNIGQTNRKTVNITMWPSSVEIGETKSRRINRLKYVGELKTILSPDSLSILPD